MAPSVISERSISRARQLRRGMTDGEKRLWAELKQFRKLYGLHARRQVPIGSYVADFAIHSAKLVIEIDGEFHTGPGRIIKDNNRDAWLNGAGYCVLRFRTGELDSNFDGCIEEVLATLGLRN